VLTVATAIFGPGFPLHEPKDYWGCHFVCFTDRADLRSERWQVVHQARALSPRRSNRHVKALLHRYVSGPTLYIDAEFQVVADPRPVAEAALERHHWAATRHPNRDCLFDEAAVCLEKNRVESPEALTAQVDRYRAVGMPEHSGLWAGNIIARRGDPESQRLGDDWWAEIERGSERDQVSLPFVAWKLGLPPGEIPGFYTSLPWLARRKRERKYL